MKSSDIFPLLSRLESLLGDYSVNELGFEDASRLKAHFQAFKTDLEHKIGKDSEINPVDIESIDRPDKAESREIGLIVNMGHGIRTPLNDIIDFTESLKDSALDPVQSVRIDALRSASYSLLEIVNELLEYSRLAAGLEQFQRLEFNPQSLIRDVMYLCNTLITNKELTLTSSIGKDIPERLVGDPSKLTQVLLKLVGYVIKYMGKGEIQLNTTSLKALENAHLLQFRIIATGLDGAKEKITEIFGSFSRPYSQTLSKNGRAGFGLGIAKQIIDKLGGQISVVGKPNVGTTITFTLPFGLVDPSADSRKSKLENNKNNGSKDITGLKILVFEDNELNQWLIEKRLKALECETHITDDGTLGMKILDEHHIDVVLMDLRMPKMNGFEISKRIRESGSQRIRQIPIIALTADYTIKDREKCHSYGIDDYLLKPFSAEELLKKLISSQGGITRPQESVSGSLAKVSEKGSFDADCPMSLAPLLSHCMGDLNIVLELIELFKQNINEFFQKTRTHLAHRDVDGLRFSCHKIKAGLAMLNAKGLLRIIEEMKDGFESDIDWEYLEYQFARFSKRYPEVEKAIDLAVQKLKER